MATALNHKTDDFEPEPCHSFDAIVAASINQIQRSAEGLTLKESQLLRDMKRGRYLGGLAQALEIAKYRCRNPADATAFAEAMRGFVLHQHPGLRLSWFDVLRYEGSTNAAADEALVEHILAPSMATRERMIETHHAQAIASRAVVDLIHHR